MSIDVHDLLEEVSVVELVQAEKQHREHAISEQVNADLKDSAPAHMPSGSFAANAAWLALPLACLPTPDRNGGSANVATEREKDPGAYVCCAPAGR
ncbi:MAG: hypothetical protein ACRDRU_25580 [Pseudonocardiaceae bacterium]